jgi:hypothetical protein
VRRLTKVAAALHAIYEAEAKKMRFEGPLDEMLLSLQDLFEALLLKLKHPAPAVDDGDIASADGDDTVQYELGTDDEIETSTRMARTLAGNEPGYLPRHLRQGDSFSSPNLYYSLVLSCCDSCDVSNRNNGGVTSLRQGTGERPRR